MRVAIIHYNAGNIQSVAYALDRLDIDYLITSNVEQIQSADKVIFPGVGEAKSAMNFLRSNNLHEVIPKLSQPVLGICLGMQVMCQYSEENDTTCMGIFPENVVRFKPDTLSKVPHMGWNQLTKINSWLPDKLENKNVYFVHSYYVPVNVYTAATAEYTIRFSASMKKDNFYAVQFHPEKSAETGEDVLKAFLSR